MPGSTLMFFVSVHRALHLLRWRSLEVHEYVCMPAALHLQNPVNAYNSAN